MELVADILLAAGALGAGLYCFVLARRLKRFNDLEKGVGGAVAVLSSQVDTLSRTLAAAQAASGNSNAALDELTRNAEAVAKRLELMMAAMHDVPPPKPEPEQANAGETKAQDQETPKPAVTPGVMFMRHDRSGTGGI
ncbi:hypothetical protein SAMN05444007_111144 [Cribrihabitans marinus]|uniref:Uncharacterized protein n=1 Tax=Cribrihabitans marinus TaxID=1227549 RepID=A0A1H7DPS5_9RHOB|nr:hypothetical protein [Cribrihabitans marinus]GGH39415.1 hypothetical protein GCM10010973_35260 [Cribrihabitans marinus]SEK01280.1 hypothetical protein SAMN05444007_111144 [Cribrihabitans marinus]